LIFPLKLVGRSVDLVTADYRRMRAMDRMEHNISEKCAQWADHAEESALWPWPSNGPHIKINTQCQSNGGSRLQTESAPGDYRHHRVFGDQWGLKRQKPKKIENCKQNMLTGKTYYILFRFSRWLAFIWMTYWDLNYKDFNLLRALQSFWFI